MARQSYLTTGQYSNCDNFRNLQGLKQRHKSSPSEPFLLNA